MSTVVSYQPDSDALQDAAPKHASPRFEEICRSLNLALDDPRVPFVLLFQQLRNQHRFRFIPLRYTDVIGELAMDTEIYLCERDAGLHGQGFTDIFFHMYHLTPTTCNEQLKTMWERTLPVWPITPDFVRQLEGLPSDLPIQVPPTCPRDNFGLLETTPRHLSFTPDEVRHGQSVLKQLGIPPATPWVCFHARDGNYDASLQRYESSFTTYRDSHLQNMIPSAEALADLGYFTLRMGKEAQEECRSQHPGVIDYAASPYRSDFMDLFLMAHCHFFFGGDAGIYALAELFRRPYVFVNFPVMYSMHVWNPMPFLPKHFQWRQDGRPLKHSELLQLEREGMRHYDQKYRAAGVELVENTAEEIQAVVMEAEARLRDDFSTTAQDEMLQERFWSVYTQGLGDIPGTVRRSRIGRDFLRQNPHWLE